MIEGYVSLEAAREIYGVVLNDKGLSLNEEATQDQRSNMRNMRKLFTIGVYKGNARFTKGMKVIMLNNEEAASYHAGDLVEIYHDKCAAPYRARVMLRSTVKHDHALIDEETKRMMGVQEGSALRIVKIFSR